MKNTVEIKVLPAELHSEEVHRSLLASQLGVSEEDLPNYRLLRRSLDARHKKAHYLLRFEVGTSIEGEALVSNESLYKDVSKQEEIHIVGAGPAGLFAALRLIEHGYRPVVFERGKDVRRRRFDVAALSKQGSLDPESNYCFGEGGAGTFSDGKLYTRSTKRGDVVRILENFVRHGADPRILIDTHPHIGTNKLPKIVSNMRESIQRAGGEVIFDARLSDIEHDSAGLRAISVEGVGRLSTHTMILATGHSARDVYALLHHRGIALEAKPFALGVRVEHPQSFVDLMQYGEHPRHPNLPAATYSLKAQAHDRGVFSFCMCPGGVICPAATSQGEVVVNGWSPSKRNGKYANSGIVLQLTVEDLLAENPNAGIWAGLEFQQTIEQRAFKAGGGCFVAPAQRLSDFIEKRASSSLPSCSYKPGVESVELTEVLGKRCYKRLREGLLQIAKRIPSFLSSDAIVLAPESRTSSPLRIPRERETLEHPQVSGLFPCAEGAGYAGGIMSAAIDGERVADAIASLRQGSS